MISINNNMGGMRSMDALQQSHRVLQTALERLSTGIRINRAEDDAAGLMVRDRFQAQVNGFEEGIRNIQTAQGMIQVAEQGLNKVTEALQQMRALAVRAADDNLNDEDRGRIQEQVKGLLREINERAANTSYNGHKLLDGSIADSHEERMGQLKTQSQSFLANGGNLIRSGSTTGTAATTANAISQGSYQVRLVHTGAQGVTPSATSLTQLKGVLNSGPNGDTLADSSTLNQIVTDRNGAAHTASFTFTQVGDGSRNFNYAVNIAAGGVYSTAQSFTGTVEFNADGTIKAVDNHDPSQTRSVVLADGTSDGQDWAIDFSGLVENQHDTTLLASTSASAISAVTPDGSAGMTASMAVTGALAETTAVLGTQLSTAMTFVDRSGEERTVSILFTKTSDGDDAAGGTNETWDWSVSSFSAGTLALSSTSTGTLSYNDDNTALPVALLSSTNNSLVITDTQGYSQTVTMDFTALNLDSVAAPINGTPDDAVGDATANVAVTAALNPVGGSVSSAFTVRDNTGLDLKNNNQISFSYVSGNTWSYTITPDASTAGAGDYTTQSFTGTVLFDSAGNVASVNGVAGTTVNTLWATDPDDDTVANGTQSITFDFSSVTMSQGAANATNNGVQGTQSTAIGLTNLQLSASNNVSDSHTTAAFNVVDRTGAEHSVSITFTKTGEDAATQTYSYEINGLEGGVWTGDTSGNASGTLVFNAAGSSLLTVNGGSSTSFNLRVGDGTSDDQNLGVSFAGLVANAAGNNAAASDGGTGVQGSPTTEVELQDNIFNGNTPHQVAFSVVDRTGQNTNTAYITFSQTSQDSRTWNYTISAPSEAGVDGYNGFGSNLQGTVEFDAAGNIIKLDGSDVLDKSITFEDRTDEDHTFTMDFSRLNMAAGDDFSDSISDGGSGTEAGEVAAVIYFSDGSGTTDVNPVCTLNAVDIGAKTYSAGGISFTVEQASTLDVGLTSYLKAYTYISATQDDRSLTFQVGPDEGNVTRVGISRMDVDTIFRRNAPEGGTSSYTDVDLGNALKAQDLIGQIDDALNFVGGENLKVGQFQNKFSRTLDLARQQMTSITGALSNLNDADMAKEATNQSKRSILVQSGTAMVAQANSQGQFLLQLLR